MSASICANANVKYDEDKNESLHVAISPNANGLSDQYSLHTQGRRRVANASHRGKLYWSLNIIRHLHSSFYSHYAQVES